VPDSPLDIRPIETPKQFSAPQLGFELEEVDNFIRASEARHTFSVNGSGLTVAVLDTGLRTTHVDFAGRVVAQRNFTADNNADPANANDGDGHGTNVGGIIVANGDHIGIAPGANIIPIRVLANNGGGSFQAIRDALQWVLDNRVKHNITAVCMSLGDSGNYQSDTGFPANDGIATRIRALREAGVAVGIAGGNDFFSHDSEQGMSYPAIFRESVSVGAVYDDFEGPFTYSSGASTSESGPDRITPFSQRLHENVNADCRTDVFAPGAPVTSSGIQNDHGESVQHGTSQATPVTVGVILLMQQLHHRLTGRLPSVDDLVTWLRRSGVTINDGDDEVDNVTHTGLDFIRVNAFHALEAVRRHLQKELFLTGQPLAA
jgi:subtilisin family serine protease